jgi:hypothetical protein
VEQAREQTHLEGHRWITGGLELAVAVLLGLTVMAIAWGAYQAELKEKDADHYFNRSDETLGTAHRVELQGDQQVATDEQLFLELSRDQAEGRTQAVAYIRRHLATPGFIAAVKWWEDQPAAARPPSPFVDANPRYHNAYYERGRELETQATGYLKRAHKAEQRAIDYTIVSVLLTVGLFLLGISTQVAMPWLRLGLILLGVLVLLGSAGRFADLALS